MVFKFTLVFLSYLFLIFCEFQKNQKSMPICINLMKFKF
jgi:hypothetical protein